MTFNDKPKRPGSKPFLRDKPMPKREDTNAAKPAPSKLTKANIPDDAERISKVMARVGVASRRDIERMIMEGRVKLNGVQLDSPVINVTLTDKIEVDGVPIRGIERTRLWLYHKPAGLVTTNADPEGRDTVFDNLPDDLPRVMSIGRLDINTEGLLLLTNDGGLARVLELPTTGWLRRYRVRAHGEIDQDALDKLKEGIAVDGVLYGSIEATLDKVQGSNVWITMGLREGKNREIKNVLGVLGLEVNRLIRISYGPFQLGDLPEGQAVEVRGRTLRDQLGPRLVEDAKANFDAPIYNVTGGDAADDDEAPAARPQQRDDWVKREKSSDKRAPARGHLDTKREDSKGGARGKDDDRPKRAPMTTPRRSANVWMAPGARPLGEKAAEKVAKNLERYGPSTRGPRVRPGSERPDEGPRVRVSRVSDSEGEWIRATDDTDDAKGKGGGFGRKSAGSDRPPRGDKPFGDRAPRGDRPQGAKSFGDRPARSDKPFGDRAPRADKPFGDRPRGPSRPRTEGEDRPRTNSFRSDSRSDAPRGDRPSGDRPPRGDRPQSDRPRGERPERARPQGDRPYTGRPRTEGEDRPRAKPFRSDAPRGDRPVRSERPQGERSFGDKPRSDRPTRSFDGDQRSERPARTERPSGERSYGEKPAGAKPAGRPYTGKPAGKSFGGKPAGKPGAKSFSGKPRDGAGSGRPAGGAPRGGPKGKRG
ncbi:pseudouridine synthase [Rhizobium tumorigenes]|uniref:pseudouridine synthase n=1 Tax=Rhizobium tumorigenes TaxID=2041385 RepID=UPI0013DDCB92